MQDQDAAGWIVRIEVERDGGMPPLMVFCVAACEDEGDALEAVLEAYGARGLIRTSVKRATIAQLGLEQGQVWML